MKILLDECVPAPMQSLLSNHACTTVQAKGWSGIRNGDLLQRAEAEFDLFTTSDQNIRYQPGTCYLDVTKQPSTGDIPITTHEELPLGGLITPDAPTLEDLRGNESLVRSCDEYDWIMISNLFPTKVAYEIAHEWEKPKGKLEQERQRKERAR